MAQVGTRKGCKPPSSQPHRMDDPDYTGLQRSASAKIADKASADYAEKDRRRNRHDDSDSDSIALQRHEHRVSPPQRRC